MNRQEHLQWCKDRALALVDTGNHADALASMLSDLGKHPETAGVANIMGPFGMMQLATGQFADPEQIRKFINGFN